MMSVVKPCMLISIVIPTRNAGPGFEHVLQSIRGQEMPDAEVEIVLVDSSSTDGTPTLGERYGAKVIPISPRQYNHGQTRNLGIQHSQGELVACMVQDAQPANAEWLASLAAAVRSDPQVAGAYSRQLPWPADDALTRFLVHQWHRVQGEQRVVQVLPPPAGLASLPFHERRRLCAFDDVSSMLRRDVWERFPFRAVQFAEDIDWARRVLEAGYRIVYEPASQVHHSHVRPFLYNLKRQYVDERVLMERLEADDATVRTWNGPRQVGGLVLRVLHDAQSSRDLSPRLIARTLSFAMATMLGSLARRVIHPRLQAERACEWYRRWDARFFAGV
jgi:rhamnosyltransferase